MEEISYTFNFYTYHYTKYDTIKTLDLGLLILKIDWNSKWFEGKDKVLNNIIGSWIRSYTYIQCHVRPFNFNRYIKTPLENKQRDNCLCLTIDDNFYNQYTQYLEQEDEKKLKEQKIQQEKEEARMKRQEFIDNFKNWFWSSSPKLNNQQSDLKLIELTTPILKDDK